MTQVKPYTETYGLNNRRIYLFESIEDNTAQRVIDQILYLNDQNTQDITLLINSDGGSVDAALAIISVMHAVESEISTVCLGKAHSSAADILVAGQKDKRYISHYGSVFVHQTQGNTSGNLDKMKGFIEECGRLTDRLYELYGTATRQGKTNVTQDLKNDRWFSPEQAIRYGLVDHIVFRGQFN